MKNKELIEKIKHCGIEEMRLAIEKIEKDLKVLDILKKHYDKDSLILSLGDFMSFHIHNDDKDFNKVKGWLENDKSI